MLTLLVLTGITSTAHAEDWTRKDVKSRQRLCDIREKAPSCVELGRAALDGDVGAEWPQSTSKAKALGTKACAMGDFDGCVLRGDALRSEVGEPAQASVAEQALDAYREACDGGHAAGCEALSTNLDQWSRLIALDAEGRAVHYDAVCAASSEPACARATAVRQMHGADEMDRLTEGPVFAALQAGRESLRACYMHALGRHFRMNGPHVVRFGVLENGKVFDAHLPVVPDNDAEFATCVGDALASLSFPSDSVAAYAFDLDLVYEDGSIRLAGDPPAGKIDHAGVQVMGGLSREQVIEHAALENAEGECAHQGKVLVRFTIDPEGAVQGAALKGASLEDREVVDQVLADVQKLTFPAPAGDAVMVSYPFEVCRN